MTESHHVARWFPGLVGLVDLLGADVTRFATRWQPAHELVQRWAGDQPDLLAALREQLRALPPAAGAHIAAGSRETTTHFAWRLVHDDALPFSLWLHQYKPRYDQWLGYANSVHNHRYHFSSIVLAGGFQHEWYHVDLDPTGERVFGLSCAGAQPWRPGPVRLVTAERFHRVARAVDGTVTFVVKSAPVRGWSLSVDPATMVSRRHVPVEGRIGELAERI